MTSTDRTIFRGDVFVASNNDDTNTYGLGRLRVEYDVVIGVSYQKLILQI